jgi:hypothetical protein
MRDLLAADPQRFTEDVAHRERHAAAAPPSSVMNARRFIQ